LDTQAILELRKEHDVDEHPRQQSRTRSFEPPLQHRKVLADDAKRLHDRRALRRKRQWNSPNLDSTMEGWWNIALTGHYSAI
jgi:hypothetical protein